MFTSGTLSPISYYEIRLGLKFGVIFNNDNVFDSKKNLKVAVINKSLDKRQNFNFTYRNRENIILFKELGNAIISIISVIPNGVLVFFPSYGLMQKCGCMRLNGMPEPLRLPAQSEQSALVDSAGRQEYLVAFV